MNGYRYINFKKRISFTRIIFNFSACLASFATEQVVDLCHGHRKCLIAANSSTFGDPCRPESRTYLKVVYTCGKYTSFIYESVRIQKNEISNTLFFLFRRSFEFALMVSKELVTFRGWRMVTTRKWASFSKNEKFFASDCTLIFLLERASLLVE